jgi:hypothetical protein
VKSARDLSNKKTQSRVQFLQQNLSNKNTMPLPSNSKILATKKAQSICLIALLILLCFVKTRGLSHHFDIFKCF